MTYETKEYKGYLIEIDNDDCSLNPRVDYDNLGTMYCFHRRYDLGDKHDLSQEEVQTMVNSGDYIALPLYLYDHSGITMNTTGFSCPWDSGCVGVIMVEKKKIREEYGWKRITKERQAQIEKYLKGEVETYDNYLTGNVYGYRVKKEGEEIETDSCWGFFGTDFEKNGLLEYAHNAIDCHIDHIEKTEGVQTELALV